MHCQVSQGAALTRQRRQHISAQGVQHGTIGCARSCKEPCVASSKLLCRLVMLVMQPCTLGSEAKPQL